MNGDEKGNLVTPTTTVLPARLAIFQPSQRPKQTEGTWFQTSFGRCKVTGRLGQRHADVLESILYVAEKRREIEDGGVELLVDPAKVRRSMSDHNYSIGRIKAFLRELRTAEVEIVTPEMEAFGESMFGGMIDHVEPSPMTRPDPLTGKERPLWRVRLGKCLVTLLGRDLPLYYKPAPIARLQHGVSQAVARHILTHKHDPAGGWHLDTLLRAVCGEDAKSQTMRDGRRRIREDLEQLAKLGIHLNDENRISRGTTARERGTAARERGTAARI